MTGDVQILRSRDCRLVADIATPHRGSAGAGAGASGVNSLKSRLDSGHPGGTALGEICRTLSGTAARRGGESCRERDDSISYLVVAIQPIDQL
jgi:hypothetical protein